MTGQKLHSLFNNKKNVLIVTGAKHNADIIFAGQALSLLLKQTNVFNRLVQKNVSSSKIWREKIKDFPELVISPTLPKTYEFSLPVGISPENITWEKLHNEYRVKIQANGEILGNEKTVEIKEEVESTDLLVFIGNKSDITAENLGITKELYENIPKLIILSNKIFLNNQELIEETMNSSKSFSFRLFEVLKMVGQNLNYSKEVYTLLLAGIINHTNSFKKNVNSKVFERIKDLIDLRGDYQQAYHLSINNFTLKKLLQLSSLFASTKELGEGVYEARLKINSKNEGKVEVSEMMKISEVFNAKIVIIIVEYKGTNKIYIKSRLKSLDLKSLLKEFKGKGNNSQGVIETKKDVDKTLQKVYPKLFVQFQTSRTSSTHLFHTPTD